MLVDDKRTPYAPVMASPARGAGLSARVLALVILYAFLVKTLLVLASPVASMGLLGQIEGASPFFGAALCLAPAGDRAGVDSESPLPAHEHDTGCCLLHCQAQVAALGVLVLVAVVGRLPRAASVWRHASHRGDHRTAASQWFDARGPPPGFPIALVAEPAA